MKSLLICLMVFIGLILVEPGFTNSLGKGLVLAGALWAGYIDGKKAGRIEAFGGKTKNPIK